MVQPDFECLVRVSYRNQLSVFKSSINLERSSLKRSLKAVNTLFLCAEFVDGTWVLISARIFIL